MAEQHVHKRMSWVTVALIVVAAVSLAVAFIIHSIPLAVVGVIVGIAGVVLGGVSGIMDDAS